MQAPASGLPFNGAGFTVVELLFALSLAAVIAGMSVAMGAAAADELRTAAAARYVAGLVLGNRMDSLKRARSVALRFEADAADYVFQAYLDTNGNGVRTTEIRSGEDEALGPVRRLSDNFRDVHFGLRADVPDADGVRGGGTDGVRIGVARLLVTSPDGTATSGTLYVRGRHAQYAVRVLGATGRTRVLKFEPGAGTWTSR
ncbi:MAG: hypothetical protein ABI603_02890 [Acidobacteriota bacterium]